MCVCKQNVLFLNFSFPSRLGLEDGSLELLELLEALRTF